MLLLKNKLMKITFSSVSDLQSCNLELSLMIIHTT